MTTIKQMFFTIGIFVQGITAWAYVPGKVALVQYNADSRFTQIEENMKNLTLLAEKAITAGAKVIVFPEGSIVGYADQNTERRPCRRDRVEEDNFDKYCVDVETLAEIIPGGKVANYWQAFADQHEVYLLFNLPEKDGTQFFNTTGVVGPDGFVGKYRKRQLYSTDRSYADAGTTEFFFNTEIGRFGLLICMDIWTESFFQSYTRQGVNGILFPTAWDQTPPEADLDFSRVADSRNMDIFASDVSLWDGTGLYSKDGGRRKRPGLPEPGVGVEDVVIIDVNY